MTAHLISYYGLPRTLVIVPTRPLLKQTRSRLKKYLSLKKVGALGDNIREVEHVTVALYQTLVRYELDKVNKMFDMVIVDEVHTGQCESYQIIMNQLTDIYYRYGFTATMKLKQPDRYIIQGIFGKPIAIVPESAAEKRVTKVNLYMLKFADDFKDGHSYTDRARFNIWQNDSRNSLVAEAVQHVISKGMNCLILTEKMAQAAAINKTLHMRGVLAPIVWNKTPEDEKFALLNDLDRKNIMCIIGTPTISVGVDIPNIEFLFIASEIKHWLPLTQRIGRGRRKTESKKVLYAADIFNAFNGDYRGTFRAQSFNKRKVYKRKGWLKGVVSLNRFKEVI